MADPLPVDWHQDCALLIGGRVFRDGKGDFVFAIPDYNGHCFSPNQPTAFWTDIGFELSELEIKEEDQRSDTYQVVRAHGVPLRCTPSLDLALDEARGHLGVRYKDYRDGGQTITMRLSGEVFVGRFLPHLAPKGFRRIRHFGFLANGAGRDALRQVQEQWLSRVLILLAVVGRLGPLIEEGCGAERGPGDWTPVCPFCGQRPVRYVPPRLERVRPEDTS